MKAIVQDTYGSADVLELRDIDRPVVEDDEVLVRVRAASVHPDVWHVLTGLPYVLRLMGAGLRKPKNPVPGTDLAGVVDSVGKNVTRFQPGDEVFGETMRGLQWVNGGAYAEYATAPEDALALKPANVTFEQAAAVPTSALIALPSLRAGGEIQAGQRVLVNGAGGGVGAIAVQLAKAFGADVTGVDCTSKLDMVRSIGADQVIDYTQEDFTRRGERYDLIFDIPGNHSLSDCRRALTPGGNLRAHRARQLRRRDAPLGGTPAPHVETDGDVTVREPAAGRALFDARQEGIYGSPEGAPRIRKAHAAHRQNLPAERGP